MFRFFFTTIFFLLVNIKDRIEQNKYLSKSNFYSPMIDPYLLYTTEICSNVLTRFVS